MTQEELVGLVESAAQARNEPPVPRQYIEEALRQIGAGEKKVLRYPFGSPSLKEVYNIAVELENTATVTKTRTSSLIRQRPP